MTRTELEHLWGTSKDKTRNRLRRLMDAGRIRCTWAPRRFCNDVINRVTVYEVIGDEQT